MDVTDPWAQAAGSNGAEQGAGSQVVPQDGQGLGGGALFGGGGKRIPSLFNRSHMKGERRGGKIVDVKDVHSRTHRNEGNLLRYWEDGNQGKGIGPVTYPVSKVTGKPNRPVMDTHLILDTDYRLTEAECELLERDKSEAAEDDGQRVFVISDVRAAQDAIAEHNKSATPENKIVRAEDLLGKNIEVIRQTNPGVKGQAFPFRFLSA